MSDRPRYGFYAAVMVAGLLLSMAGNGLHVWSQWHADVAAGIDRGTASPWVPTVAITIVPAALMVMTEAVIVAHGRNRGRARTVVTALAVVVGLIALVVSYSGLVYVCSVILGLPTALAYAAPLIVDLPIIAATVGLWDVVDQARRPTVVHDEHTRQLLDDVRDEQSVVHPDVRDEQSHGALDGALDDAHDDAHGDAHRAPDGVHEMQVRALDDVHGALDEHPRSVLDEVRDDVLCDPHGVHDEQATVRDEHVHEVHDEQPTVHRPLTLVAPRAGAHRAEDGRSLAERVHAVTSARASVEVVAEALRRVEEGESRRSVAERLGIGATTVGSWVKAARGVEQANAESVG